MIDIAVETPADAGAREVLLDRVMGPARKCKPSERLREGRLPSAGLSFVARNGGEFVGSVRRWDVSLDGEQPALLLGPLAVDRRLQSSGIGSTLMEVARDHAAALGHEGIILVGDPSYYRRFGFSRDLTNGLRMPQHTDRRRFLGLELQRGGLAGARRLVRAAGIIAFGPGVRQPAFRGAILPSTLTNRPLAA